MKKIIQVKVVTRAADNRVVGFEGDVLKVRCTTVPEKGKANEKVVELIAEYFKVSKSQVRVVKGKTGSLKWVEIRET